MPRPKKWRRVCSLPLSKRFGPLDDVSIKDNINMTVDEFETVRLIDYEGLTQEECSERMAVARTTVQWIYEAARKKLAFVLINGAELTIGGGEYMLCDGSGKHCGKAGCCRNRQNFNMGGIKQ